MYLATQAKALQLPDVWLVVLICREWRLSGSPSKAIMRESSKLTFLIDGTVQLLFRLHILCKMEATAKTSAFRPALCFPNNTFNIHTSSLFPSGSSTKTIRSPCPALMVSTVKMAGCFTMFPWGSIPAKQMQSGMLAVATKLKRCSEVLRFTILQKLLEVFCQ